MLGGGRKIEETIKKKLLPLKTPAPPLETPSDKSWDQIFQVEVGFWPQELKVALFQCKIDFQSKWMCY